MIFAKLLFEPQCILDHWLSDSIIQSLWILESYICLMYSDMDSKIWGCQTARDGSFIMETELAILVTLLTQNWPQKQSHTIELKKN